MFSKKRNSEAEVECVKDKNSVNVFEKDILSGITGLIDKLCDNDLLLIALLYILM